MAAADGSTEKTEPGETHVDSRTKSRGNQAGEDLAMISILLVEEDDLIRESLIDWLESVFGGSRVIGASFQAVPSLIAEETPQGIVVDVALEDRDAIDVVASLRDLVPETPMVVLTTASDRRLWEAVLAAGADFCLPAWDVRERLEPVLRGLLQTGTPGVERAPGERDTV